ncbi:MAG: hypothetical protein WC851_01675 [Candidatus Shapirobacteria bacterium]|jgi:hypothetical protein
MRTTIIPAQITTVEDKIAGSLNFAQILLLMLPVLWGTLVYAIFIPTMKLAPYKVSLVLLVSATSLILAIRVKDKIIAEWIGILLRYKLRPKFYIFNKNDITERLVDLPFESVANHKKAVAKTTKRLTKELSVKELIKFEQAMASKNLAVSFRYGRK